MAMRVDGKTTEQAVVLCVCGVIKWAERGGMAVR